MTALPTLALRYDRLICEGLHLLAARSYADAALRTSLMGAGWQLVAEHGGAVYAVPDAATWERLAAWPATRFYAVPGAVVEGRV